MDPTSFVPLLERLGSFALVAWFMIWGTKYTTQKLTTQMDENQRTLIRVTESLTQSNQILERTTKLIERLENRLEQAERAA